MEQHLNINKKKIIMQYENLDKLDQMEIETNDISTPEVKIEIPKNEFPDPKLFKSGKHKKTCLCEICDKGEVKPPKEKKTESAKSSFDDAISEMNQNKPDQIPLEQGELNLGDTQNAEPINAAQISGVMMLTIIDFAAPFVIVKMMSLFSPKYKDINLQKIKLDHQEKKELEEIADLVAKEYVNMSPIMLLTLGLGAIYFSKIQIQVS
jgi:hypothetical protein